MTGRSSVPGGLVVAELFGPTVQGEGPSTGQQAVFVRLSNCNLDCSWCDTAYTWDWRRFDRAAAQRVMAGTTVRDWVLARPTPLVVVTGGEPLLQQRRLVGLAEAWSHAGRRVEVETNATIAADARLVAAVSAFNVSPKLANSGVAESRRVRPAVLESFVDTGKAVFKFVVRELTDLDAVASLVHRYRLSPVWVMPEGTTSVEVLAVARRIADEVIGRGWNLSMRLHTLLWDNARGR